MEKLELEKLVNLRMQLVEKYQSLEGGNNSSNSQMRQAETAEILEAAIKDLDSVLSPHVRFG
tara:strand:- start:815 stop:1000 length:186 start_codon:yes stop_codon:yes gene_type:complete